MNLLDTLKQTMAPEKCWSLQKEIQRVLRQEITRLPKVKSITDQNRRYPEQSGDMRSFLETFFARHFFQTQDSLLQKDTFARLHKHIQTKRQIVVLDVGSGPAVASLALLNILSQMDTSGLSLKIILNDTSKICLQSGQRMVNAFLRSKIAQMPTVELQLLNTPFPASFPAIKRSVRRWGKVDFLFFSYVLVPLKEELHHAKIQEAIKSVKSKLCESNTIGLILQDRFHESLIRTVGDNLGLTTRKCTFQQKVYDPENENNCHTYTYYRTILM
jgi:ribosomal protein RSM22 (predicted rRNA methylase)